MNRKVVAPLAGLVAIVAAIAGVTVSATGDSTNKTEAPSPADYVSAPGNLSHFAVLSDTSAKTDLPDELHPESLPIEVGNARELASNDAGRSWISADEKTMCVSLLPASGGGGAGCRSTYEASKGFAFTNGDHSVGVTVAGIAPDGVKEVTVEMKNGDRQTIPVEGNGFVGLVKGATKTISFQTQFGELNEPLPSAAG